MNDVQKAALERSIKTLSALGCTYAIIDAEKELHGSPLTVLDELGSTYAVIDSAGVRHGLVSAVLEKMECQYVITTKEGMKYSNTIDKTPEPEAKPARQFPHGDTRAYVKSFVLSMAVGDTVSIPAEKYGVHNIQNSVTSWFVSTYGKNSCTTFQNKTTNAVDVMRIG
jgi:hypothetical protein